MKLLKRTADGAKKHLVLITSETGLLPLAGAVGVYVAKTLQSKPEIPVAPSKADQEEHEEAVNMNDAPEERLDKSRPIGEYVAPTVATGAAVTEDEAIDFDNDAPVAAVAAKSPKGKKDRKFSIPDFNKFRTWIILGGATFVLLILFWYVGFVVMPKATVTVKTDSSAVNTNVDITFDTTAEAVDVDAGVVPAKVQSVQKTVSQEVPATGQKDKGTKSSGKVTIKNCGASEVTIPSGTAVSANGLTFITQSRIDLDDGKFGGVCKASGEHIATVDVVAQQAGEQYNLDARSDYQVAGQSNTVTANGTAMTGGTSVIIKVIAQADIDNAKQKITAQDTTPIKLELNQGLKDQGLYAADGTFAHAEPEVTTSAKVGDEAENVTVTQKTTYTMAGAKEGDLKKIIANEVNKEIDPTRQTILDHGLTEAVFRLQNQQATEMLVALEATAVAGSDLDLTNIKKQIAGKKANDAKEIISEYPGVTDVKVHYSPFWVSSIPGNTGKITLTVEKPAVKDAR
jgi:hypothetical protein